MIVFMKFKILLMIMKVCFDVFVLDIDVFCKKVIWFVFLYVVDKVIVKE